MSRRKKYLHNISYREPALKHVVCSHLLLRACAEALNEFFNTIIRFAIISNGLYFTKMCTQRYNDWNVILTI